jgi:hypothetical protein
VEPPPGAVDARAQRTAQGTVGVVLLGAFVFGLPWLAAAVAVLLGPGALAGPDRNVLLWLYARTVAPRLGSAPATEGAVDAGTVRAQDAFVAAVLVLASLTFTVGAAGIGWLLVVAVAVTAVVAATTRVHVGEYVLRRFLR